MPAQKIVSSQDGPRLTVSMVAKSPTVIPARIISMLNQAFLVDVVCRMGDDIPSGVAMYFESTPLFVDEDPAVLDEFGEIPVTNGSIGTPKVVRSVRRALGLRVSKTQMDRNQMSVITNQLTQIKNTMTRAWEDAFFSAILANANILTIATDQHWGSSTSHIRKDVNSARYLIKNAASDAAGKNKFGFEADTLILSTEMELDFLDSDEVTKPYEGGNIADQNLKYTGVLPKKFLTLDVLVSWRMAVYAPSSAMVLQRKVCAFISDERKLESTPMYPEGGGGNGGPKEAWRCDTTRASAVGVDQPKAICLITGVTAGETAPASGGTITA